MRWVLVLVGVLGLIGSCLRISQGSAAVPGGAEGVGFLVGSLGLPLGLILVGLTTGKTSSTSHQGSGSERPPLSPTAVPSSWSQLSPVTKVAVGCLGAVLAWLLVVVVVATIAHFASGA